MKLAIEKKRSSLGNLVWDTGNWQWFEGSRTDIFQRLYLYSLVTRNSSNHVLVESICAGDYLYCGWQKRSRARLFLLIATMLPTSRIYFLPWAWRTSRTYFLQRALADVLEIFLRWAWPTGLDRMAFELLFNPKQRCYLREILFMYTNFWRPPHFSLCPLLIILYLFNILIFFFFNFYPLSCSLPFHPI